MKPQPLYIFEACVIGVCAVYVSAAALEDGSPWLALIAVIGGGVACAMTAFPRIGVRQTPLAFLYFAWTAMFLAASVPAMAFSAIESIARRLSDAFCDLGDLASAQGRKLLERLQ
jgi:hypothetical protein